MKMKNNPQEINTFSAAKACELSGVSRFMLDYLIRERFIVPSGSTVRGRGHRRLFSFGDVVTLRVISQLLRSGIEIRRLWRGLRALRKKVSNVRPGELPFRFLVTDGTDIFLETNSDIESLTRDGQLAFAFLIDLRQCSSEIAYRSKDFGRRAQTRGMKSAQRN